MQDTQPASSPQPHRKPDRQPPTHPFFTPKSFIASFSLTLHSPPTSLPKTPLHSIIIIKNLIRILQNRIHNPDLPPRIRNTRPGGGAHERRAEDDGQVLGAHAVRRRVVDDAVQVQGQGAEGGVVRIGQAVDDGVEGVAADDVVFVSCGVGWLI